MNSDRFILYYWYGLDKERNIHCLECEKFEESKLPAIMQHYPVNSFNAMTADGRSEALFSGAALPDVGIGSMWEYTPMLAIIDMEYDNGEDLHESSRVVEFYSFSNMPTVDDIDRAIALYCLQTA